MLVLKQSSPTLVPAAPRPVPQKTLPSARTKAAFVPCGRASSGGASVISADKTSSSSYRYAPERVAGRGRRRKGSVIGSSRGDRTRGAFRQDGACASLRGGERRTGDAARALERGSETGDAQQGGARGFDRA